MKFKINSIVLILMLVFSSVFFNPLSVYSYEDSIVAIVNDEVITLRDLREYISSTYMRLSLEGVHKSKLNNIMKDLSTNGLNKLIEDKLILSKANQIGIMINDKEVSEKLNGIKSRYDTEDIFVESLIQNGATISDLVNKIRDQLKIKYTIEHFVKSKVFINPKEITKYYEENFLKFKRGARVNIDSIYIRFDDNEDKAKLKVEKLLRLLEDGRDFTGLMKEFSDAPAIGIIEKGQFIDNIEDVIFNLGEGEVSDLVEVDTGYYIFKLIGKIDEEISKLKEVEGKIDQLIFNEKFHKQFIIWVNELKEEAYIEVKEQ